MARISWNNPTTGEKAQFVADVFRETLFNYAFDSNKVPTLNLHSFCIDFLNTARRVDRGVIQEPNMIPLVEEFEHLIINPRWLPKGVSQSVLSFRNKLGIFDNISKNKNIDTTARAKYYRDSVNYIAGLLQSDNNYLKILLVQIEQLLKSSSFTQDDKSILYHCLREFLSEIINMGVSKTHLYNQTKTVLFTASTPDDDIAFIMDFLNSILPSRKKYSVIFGVSERAYTEMSGLLSGVRVSTHDEYVRLKSKYVAETELEEYDPVSALVNAKGSFSSILNIYNCCIHDTDIKTNPNGLVKKDGASRYSLINDATNLLRKNKNKIKQERVRWLEAVVTRTISPNLFSSFELNNNALVKNDPQTQLLNLWTIIELLIETKQDQMAKVNYVSNVMCSILCNIYFSRLVETLYNQISLSTGVKTIIRSETRGNNDIQKLAFILKDNSAARTQILSAISDYPLEVYKVELLSDVFSSPAKMKAYLVRHSNRLRWQIMRIYRNRCMIVHNGSHCDYIDSIVENLHYYVDELFDYIFLRMSEGITNTKAIFAYSRVKEQEHMESLSIKSGVLSDDEYLSVIFDF